MVDYLKKLDEDLMEVDSVHSIIGELIREIQTAKPLYPEVISRRFSLGFNHLV